jgi:hypothetical protein
VKQSLPVIVRNVGGSLFLELVVYVSAKKHHVMSRMVWEALQLGSDARQGPLPRLLAGECSGEWQALGATRRPFTACERGQLEMVARGCHGVVVCGW